MKDDVSVIDKLEDLYKEIEDYIELGNEEEDQEIVDTVGVLIEEFEESLEKLRMKTLSKEIWINFSRIKTFSLNVNNKL